MEEFGLAEVWRDLVGDKTGEIVKDISLKVFFVLLRRFTAS